MKDRSTLATINDLFYAALVGAVLVVSTVGLSSELFGFRGEEALSLAVSAATEASMAYGATLTTQPLRAAL